MPSNILHNAGLSLPVSFPYVYGERIESLYPGVSVRIERITPEVAKQMLVTNVHNRKIKSAPLDTVREAMNNDEWMLNGEAIVFDKLGRLLDGQHRLTSCVKTGKTIDVIVIRGVEEDAQDTIDNGTRRQLSDYTKMDGYKNYIDVATIGKVLARKDDIGITPTLFDNNSTKRSLKALRRFIRECHDERIEPLIPHTRAIISAYKSTPLPMLGALLDEFRKADDTDFDEFVAQLTNKSAACVPVRLLQRKLVENASESNKGHAKYKSSFLAAYFIKTWNAYICGDEMKRLTYSPGGKNPEGFPEVFFCYDD